MEREEEIKVTRWKIHRAITLYGLGGSDVILDNIMRVLGDLENVHDDSSPVGALFGRLCTSNGQDGEGKKQVV